MLGVDGFACSGDGATALDWAKDQNKTDCVAALQRA
eukprot:CAMPEP_0205913224 /NCGR_PEP_ID=MMETSP1325-20131115/6391_1 /ASSEMBLY_ACC=CAM_ASM_000708 /TAXON_ID=236786 /ORGANISM="Florenciella sp., Strain RCC1007" /LENGTH=35 /DNA_ID= /DNA_START= /DNA_END= /DNA_ORIENTATION=